MSISLGVVKKGGTWRQPLIRGDALSLSVLTGKYTWKWSSPIYRESDTKPLIPNSGSVS